MHLAEFPKKGTEEYEYYKKELPYFAEDPKVLRETSFVQNYGLENVHLFFDVVGRTDRRLSRVLSAYNRAPNRCWILPDVMLPLEHDVWREIINETRTHAFVIANTLSMHERQKIIQPGYSCLTMMIARWIMFVEPLFEVVREEIRQVQGYSAKRDSYSSSPHLLRKRPRAELDGHAVCHGGRALLQWPFEQCATSSR